MTSDITTILLGCDLFDALTRDEVAPLAGLCQVEHYEAGENVFTQGEEGTKMYIIDSGQVTLERTVDLGERTAIIPVTTLGRGRAFGCWSSLLDRPHKLMSAAVCNTPTEIISVEGAVLRHAFQSNLEAGYKVLERLALLLGDRLRGVYGAMEKL